jgi:hypothetical protein
MTRTARLALLAALAAPAGCAYSNAMWNAEHLAAEARRLEAQGRVDEARGQWMRAAGKAESLPSDAALALRAEALAKSGSCEAAAAPIARALERLTDPRARERVGLAAAECALTADRPGEVEGVLAEARASGDRAHRSRAEYLSGRAAAARGDHDAAVAHFRRSSEPAAAAAGVRALLAAAAARAETPADLAPVAADLRRLPNTDAELSSLRNLVERVAGTPAALRMGAGAAFRAAELARDSLGAPRLAGRMLLDLAAADSASLFAPKALVAALPLLPERRDSILRVLDSAYPASPYTRALHGDPSPAYAAAEDSLAKELGMRSATVRPGARRAVNGPSTGPRGPWLEAPRP